MQMLETDDFGNNPLHFAFRTKKPASVELLIRAGYGDIDFRNKEGKTPKEATHYRIMDKTTENLLAQFDPTAQRPKEPDYLFVCSAQRYEVLVSQLECLKLEYKIFKHTLEPDKKVLVLVFFDD